jgi:hypothetical protein
VVYQANRVNDLLRVKHHDDRPSPWVSRGFQDETSPPPVRATIFRDDEPSSRGKRWH